MEAFISRWQALQQNQKSASPAPQPARPQVKNNPEGEDFWWAPDGRRYYIHEYERRYLDDPYYWRPWYYHHPVPHYYRHGSGVSVGTGIYFLID